MRRISKYKHISYLGLALAITLVACKKEEYALPVAKSGLQNDAIKRSIGPNIVGEEIEFAYAMAILPDQGRITEARVEASIAGAAGTFLENRSFFTNGSGNDVGVDVGSPSVTNGNTTTVTFNKDTSAATLRYYYVIPEEARGQSVTFTFTALSSNNQTVTYTMGPYTISRMDIIRNLTVTNGDQAYISIEDMAVYDSTEAAANPGKIDMVYLYRKITTSPFEHALVSPVADASYLPDVMLPAGLTRSTKMRKAFNLQDYNLARLQFGIYIDDRDFLELNLADSPNYAINLRAEAGVWVETADGRYRAYVFLNSVNAAGRAVISIKRLAL